MIRRLFGKVTNREAHEAYARLNGYFWLPCPVCNEWFGGHEEGGGSARYVAPKRTPDHRSVGTCPNCPGYWEIRSTRVTREHHQREGNGPASSGLEGGES